MIDSPEYSQLPAHRGIIVVRNTVFNPAPVIALTHINSESTYDTSLDDPQKIRLHTNGVKMKYA